MKINKYEQLEEWVNGNSIHNTKDNRCCPDFSCCNKMVVTPKETRERFFNAVKNGDEKVKMEMLGSFLKQAALTLGKSVYVAGVKENEQET